MRSLPPPFHSFPHSPISSTDDELYVLHELSSTLTVQSVPSFPNGTSPIIGNVSILPSNPPPGALFAAAEILIPTPTPEYPIPYIYVSNRNTGVQDSRGDTIAIYQRTNNTYFNDNTKRGTSDSALTLITEIYTGLDQIRGMEFGSSSNTPGGNDYLIAGGVAGTAGVVVFKRTKGGADLDVVVRNVDIGNRSSFVWVWYAELQAWNQTHSITLVENTLII